MCFHSSSDYDRSLERAGFDSRQLQPLSLVHRDNGRLIGRVPVNFRETESIIQGMLDLKVWHPGARHIFLEHDLVGARGLVSPRTPVMMDIAFIDNVNWHFDRLWNQGYFSTNESVDFEALSQPRFRQVITDYGYLKSRGRIAMAA